MTDPPAPRACPFCGGPSSDDDDPAISLIDDMEGQAWIVCKVCGANGPIDADPDAALAKWNTRTTDTPRPVPTRAAQKRERRARR